MEPLLQLLKQNSRFSNQQLAAMLDMTESEVAAKIKEYEKNGVFSGCAMQNVKTSFFCEKNLKKY